MTAWFNGLAAFMAVLLSLWLAMIPEESRLVPSDSRSRLASSEIIERDGVKGLIDATGHFVPIRDYRRIISASSLIDGVLRELCEPSRVLYFSGFNAEPEHNPYAFWYADKVMPTRFNRLEALISYEPDLILINNLAGPERVARLRQAGLTVFDLGEMRGISTLLPNIRTLGALLGRPEVADDFARSFERRLNSIASHIPRHERPSAIYVSIIGDKAYGGTRGTSYADMLEAAGLRDAAADRYTDWPAYSPEQMLELDPEIIVTRDTKTQFICSHPGLRDLRACGPNGRIIGISEGLAGDPGLPLLVAAERLHEAVYENDGIQSRHASKIKRNTRQKTIKHDGGELTAELP